MTTFNLSGVVFTYFDSAPGLTATSVAAVNLELILLDGVAPEITYSTLFSEPDELPLVEITPPSSVLTVEYNNGPEPDFQDEFIGEINFNSRPTSDVLTFQDRLSDPSGQVTEYLFSLSGFDFTSLLNDPDPLASFNLAIDDIVGLGPSSSPFSDSDTIDLRTVASFTGQTEDDNFTIDYSGDPPFPIDTGAGNDTVIGTSFADDVDGGGGADFIDGRGGNDILRGGGGVDTLIGGNNDDILDGGFGFDTLNGSNGNDTATYEFSPNSVNVNLKTGTGVGAFANGDTLISIENVIGSSVGDTLTGSDFANDLVGGNGNDRLFGLQGNDTLDGGAGRDRIEGGNGTDELIGGTGNDTLEGGGSGDILNGDIGFDLVRYLSSGSGVTVNLNTGTSSGGHAAGDSFISIENVTGSFFNDQLFGDNDRNEINGRNGNDKLSGLAGADILRGGGGQDVLSGGGGNDTLLGDGGNDIFEFGGNFGDDIISDFEDGLDRIKMFGFTAGDLTLATQGSDVLLTTTNGNSILFENTALSELTGFGDFDFV